MKLKLIATAIGAVLMLFMATSPVNAQGASVVITGELDVIQVEDFEAGTSEIHYNVLDHKNNKAYRVKFNKAPKNGLTSGSQIKVRGRLTGDALFVEDGSNADDFSVTAQGPVATDERRLAVILINFQDATLGCSKASVTQSVFPDPAQNSENANMTGFYDEASFGGLYVQPDTNLDGDPDVFGPYTISASTTDGCDYYGWAYEAEDMATADGVDLSAYQHLQFVLPKASPCGWTGIANVGCGTQCRSWVAYCTWSLLYPHEFGHNLGMRHASTDTNNDGATDNTYGDNSDVMGAGHNQPNAPHKEQMGWFDGYSERIVNVNQGGTYYIAPLELNPWDTGIPQILKFPKPGTSDYYYFSYRVPSGYDSALGSAYANKLNIHRYAGGSRSTYFIRALTDGQEFSDGDFSISLVSHTTDPTTGFAEVQVSLNCSPQPLSVAFETDSWMTNAAGATLDYGVTVTNNDGSSCGSSVFNLTPTVPAGWTASVAPTTLTVQPGASVSAVLSATSSGTAADGSYPIGVRASDSTGAHGDVSVSGTYVINSAPPEAVTDLSAGIKRKTKVALNWTATYDGAGQLVGSYDIYRDTGNGFVHVASTSSTQFTDGSTASGATYRYCITAVDDAGTLSAQGNIASITVGSSGGEKTAGGNAWGKGGKGKNK